MNDVRWAFPKFGFTEYNYTTAEIAGIASGVTCRGSVMCDIVHPLDKKEELGVLVTRDLYRAPLRLID